MQVYFNELIDILREEKIVKLENILPYNPGIKFAVLSDNKCGIIFRKKQDGKGYIWDQAYDKIFDIDRDWNRGDSNE